GPLGSGGRAWLLPAGGAARHRLAGGSAGGDAVGLPVAAVGSPVVGRRPVHASPPDRGDGTGARGRSADRRSGRGLLAGSRRRVRSASAIHAQPGDGRRYRPGSVDRGAPPDPLAPHGMSGRRGRVTARSGVTGST